MAASEESCARSSPEAPPVSAPPSSSGCVRTGRSCRLHGPRFGPAGSEVADEDRRLVRPGRRSRSRRRRARPCRRRSRSSVDSTRSSSTRAFSTRRHSPRRPTRPGTRSWRRTSSVPTSTRSPACPSSAPSGGGSITAISSDAGVWGETSIGAYSVSKRALNMLVQMLARRGRAERNPRQRCLPGRYGSRAWPRTSTVAPRPEIRPAGSLPPLGRVGTGADVAAAVAFFASPDASVLQRLDAAGRRRHAGVAPGERDRRASGVTHDERVRARGPRRTRHRRNVRHRTRHASRDCATRACASSSPGEATSAARRSHGETGARLRRVRPP